MRFRKACDYRICVIAAAWTATCRCWMPSGLVRRAAHASAAAALGTAVGGSALSRARRRLAIARVPRHRRSETRRRINRRLLPFLFLLYIIAFLDRINISFAGLDMTRELGFSDHVFGLGLGHLLRRLCAARDSWIAAGGAVERPQMDRAHHDFVGPGGLAHRTHSHRPPVLLGALHPGRGRGRILSRRGGLLDALVSRAGSRRAPWPCLCPPFRSRR